MSIYVVVIAIIVIAGLKIRNDDSTILSISDTIVINGIFVLLIFLSHSTQYWPLSSSFLDGVYRHVQNIHNQWVVTTFLAFSGYGVMKSIITKDGYLDSYPYKRLLKTLINFDIAVIMYLIAAIFLGVHYNTITVIGSLFGITSVGNSNWYIFAILMMYIFSYISALTFKDNYNKQIISLSIFTLFYVSLMWLLGFEMRFYSTVMCYPLGAFLAIYREKIISVFKRKKVLTLFFIILVIGVTYKLRFNAVIMNVSSIAFVCAIVWFLCFFEIKSKILYFFGKHAFSIFILQRIPGLLLYNFVGGTNLINISLF